MTDHAPTPTIDVPKPLTDAEIRAFVDLGYHVATGPVQPEEVEEMRREGKTLPAPSTRPMREAVPA